MERLDAVAKDLCLLLESHIRGVASGSEVRESLAADIALARGRAEPPQLP